ncbi:MAG TPA: nucleoside triphosphate pyrophosphohydrolase family protein [Candidatus Dojkabacteria bacterium]|nr:nucleoside triphosphate pyrophosphohydrolase family protein [Candidatus Dojkabacteria bacterium]
MNFNEYQQKIKVTAQYPPSLRVIYPALGLGGESGEVLEKIKKVYRDKNGVFTKEDIDSISKELGDVLWYVQALCNDLGISMQDVAEQNVTKLSNRLNNNTIHGNGDDR